MATRKVHGLGDNVPFQLIVGDDTADVKVQVSTDAVVLGRLTGTGAGGHVEIPFADLPGGGGGASYTAVTYAEMETLIATSALTPGGWYLITDANGTDLGFLTNAVNENTINVSGTGGYLNADFQAVGDYANTPETFNAQLGIWRTGFETITIPYTNLQFPADYVSYTTSSGLLDPAETFTTDLGTTGTVILDDGVGTVTVESLSQALVAGEIITGDISGNTVTVDSYTVTVKTFQVGDTITGGITGATAVIVTDDGSISMTAYMTSAGIAFDGSEVLGNGAGVTADQNGVASAPAIVLGDVVIWNLLHWQLTDAALLDGTNPATNTAAYTALPRTVADVGYVAERDVVEFDFVTNELQYRSDLRGNVIRGNEWCLSFQWGNDLFYENIVNNCTGGIRNLVASDFSRNNIETSNIENIFSSGAAFLSNRFKNTNFANCSVLTGAFNANSFGAEVSINGCVFNVINFINNNFYDGSYMVNVSLLGSLDSYFAYNSLLQNAGIQNIESAEITIQNNILENGASLTGIIAGANCSISRNKIGQGATLGGSTTMGDGAAYNDLDIRANKQISNKALDAAVTFSDKIVQLTTDQTETYSANVDGNRVQPGFSDIPGTLDITGLTTLDCTAAWAQYRGIYNLTSSNATETIDTVANFPTLFPFTLRPSAGLVLTVTGTPIATPIGAGQIALTTADIILDGDKGEYLELVVDPTNTYLVEKSRLTGIV